MFYTPPGQKVAVLVLRERGAKLTYAALAAQEPMVGLIRFTHLESSANMAFHARSELALMDERSDFRSLATLRDPQIYDWNRDGLIFQGWVLETDPVDNRLQQVIQMWWVRPLETLPARPEIKGRAAGAVGAAPPAP